MEDMEVDEWQMSCVDMKQRGSKLYECGQWSDVTLEVGAERVPFRAHKLVLAMASTVFEALFFADEGAPEEDSVSIPDVTPEAFKAMLKYVYTDTISVGSFELALALHGSARRYALPQLAQVCLGYMSCNLDVRTAGLAFQAGLRHDEAGLRDESLPIIRRQTREVLKSSSFEQLELETVEQLFGLEGLQVDSELDLFLALERHAKSRFRTDAADGSQYRGALSHIRFLTLSAQQFAAHAARSPLLSRRAALALLTRLAGGDAARARLPHGLSTSRDHRIERPVSTHPQPPPPPLCAVAQLRVRVHGAQAQSAACALTLGGREFVARAVPLMVAYTPMNSRPATHYLGAFLRCEDPEPAPWECRASIEFRLYAHAPGAYNTGLRQTHAFTSEQREFGAPRFVSMPDVLSAPAGYCCENVVTLQVHVTAPARAAATPDTPAKDP